MITSTPEGCFVHWKGMKLSDLVEDEDRLVAHTTRIPLIYDGFPMTFIGNVTIVVTSMTIYEFHHRFTNGPYNLLFGPSFYDKSLKSSQITTRNMVIYDENFMIF
jgi:hypothetical protein